MKKTYIILDIADGTKYAELKTLDEVCSWIGSHCTQSVIHNNKIYATYIVDEDNTSIITVDVYFENNGGLII